MSKCHLWCSHCMHSTLVAIVPHLHRASCKRSGEEIREITVKTALSGDQHGQNSLPAVARYLYSEG